jgi:hypothetical protein
MLFSYSGKVRDNRNDGATKHNGGGFSLLRAAHREGKRKSTN